MDVLFAFKKGIAPLLMPGPILALLMIAGVLCLYLPGKQPSMRRTGRRLLTLTAILYLVLSSTWFSHALMGQLENRFQPYPASIDASANGNPEAASPKFIVVLGAGHHPASGRPPESALNERALVRLAEAARLARLLPETRIIVTGGPIRPGARPMAIDMEQLLVNWGIPRDRILTETESRDTKDHVEFLTPMLEGEDFLLVTSASHMPRAHALFRHAGFKPIPAPAGHTPSPGAGWSSWLPSEGNLCRVRVALHEYLGLLWAKLRGQI